MWQEILKLASGDGDGCMKTTECKNDTMQSTIKEVNYSDIGK